MTNFDLIAAVAATASNLLHRAPPFSSIRTVAVIGTVSKSTGFFLPLAQPAV